MHTILAMYVVHMILLLRHLPLLGHLLELWAVCNYVVLIRSPLDPGAGELVAAHLVASEHSVASPRSVFRLPLVFADKGVHIAAS
jgi:hypothetical protein